MLGRIVGIAQVNGVGEREKYDGYEVVTDKHKVYVLINNEQECCEDWGYAITYDDAAHFISAELLEIRLTDVALDQVRFPPVVEDGQMYEYRQQQFVDFVTTRGVFQVVLYNEHNGYYGHDVMLAQDGQAIHMGVL